MTSDSRASRWWGSEAIGAARPEAIWARGEQEITYARLRQEMDRIGTLLDEHQVGPGEVVALQLPNSFTLLWWLFALWARGARVLLLDPRMKAAELEAVFTRVAPRFRVTSATAADPLTAFTDECVAVFEAAEGYDARPRIDAETVLLQCSSGSTGSPKIVARTERSLLADVDRHAGNPGMPARGERVFLLAPPTHAFGLAAGVLHGLRVGTTLVLPDLLLPDELARRARKEDVHAVLGVPVHFDLLSQASGNDRIPALRLAVSCGEMLSAGARERFRARFGVPLGQAYGMSEVGAIATDLGGEYTSPTVGRVLPGVEVRVRDGELHIKTDHCPYPYSTDGGLAHRYADGWLRTSDRGEFDADTGTLRVLGRSDSVCVIGGLKVDLTEIETVLREHPAVYDAVVHVRSSAPARPERTPLLEAHVAVTSPLDTEELTAWCAVGLSDFKVPRRWHITRDLPRTPTGKIDRATLRSTPVASVVGTGAP